MSKKVSSVHSLNPRGLGKLNSLATMAYFVPLCFVHTDKRAHFTVTVIKLSLKITKLFYEVGGKYLYGS